MAVEMSDDSDDLDAFARLFGATPETPVGGLLPPEPARPAPVTPAPAGSPGDPLAWLLSDQPSAGFPEAAPSLAEPSYPTASSYPAAGFPAAGFPAAVPVAAVPVADPPPALPTRRSLAAEAGRASRETARRNLLILGGIGALVLILIIVLVVVLVAKYGSSSGSPAALLRQTPTASPSTSSTASAGPTPTETPTTTPTPTPTATQQRTVAAPPSGPPTITAAVSVQPTCTGGPTTISISYTATNADTLNLTSSDGSVNTNLVPAASGTISSVLYQCDGTGESYTLTAYSTSEGVAPASATVTPVPAG